MIFSIQLILISTQTQFSEKFPEWKLPFYITAPHGHNCHTTRVMGPLFKFVTSNHGVTDVPRHHPWQPLTSESIEDRQRHRTATTYPNCARLRPGKVLAKRAFLPRFSALWGWIMVWGVKKSFRGEFDLDRSWKESDVLFSMWPLSSPCVMPYLVCSTLKPF